MILVDDQSGSKDLYPFIKALVPDAIMTRIEPPFGDIVWTGEGPDGTALNVAVEYKKIDDVLTCMVDGRFGGHQVAGLVNHYDRRYLLVEGRIRTDRNTGVIQKLKRDRWENITRAGRGFTYRDLEHWYTTMEEFAQFRVVKTFDEYESARWVQTKHTWYTAKGWDEHKSLKQFHVPPPPVATFVRPSVLRMVLKELPGLGWDKSMAAEKRFSSILQMALASIKDWEEVEGIGRLMATRIYNTIRGLK